MVVLSTIAAWMFDGGAEGTTQVRVDTQTHIDTIQGAAKKHHVRVFAVFPSIEHSDH